MENEVTILPVQILNERRVKEAGQAIEEFYLKRGFSQARIEYEMTEIRLLVGNVIYKIREVVNTRSVTNSREQNKEPQACRNIKTKSEASFLFTGSGDLMLINSMTI